MKCGKCGKNEANYYYRQTINGLTREVRLCSDCAKEEGMDKHFAQSFAFDRGFGRSFFEDFFTPFTPLDSFFAKYLQPANASEEKANTGATEAREQQPAPMDDELKRRRERNKLEHQLKEAVAREDYETAITLRDQLKKLS